MDMPGMHTLLYICMKTIRTESTKWAMFLPTMSLIIIDDYSNGNKPCNCKKRCVAGLDSLVNDKNRNITQ